MPWIKCLGGSRGSSKTRRGKPLTVSQPIHLLAKTEFEPQCHIFRTKQLRKSRPCHLCHQPVLKLASCCRVCKYTCHKACEDKGARFRDTSQQIHKQWQADPSRAFPTVGSPPGTTAANGPSSVINSTGSSTGTSTPSPSPTNNQQNLHNSSNHNETSAKNASNVSRSKQVTSTMTRPRTPGVGADAVSIGAGNRGGAARVSEVMELNYVTERIIALWYRDDAQGILDHATTLLRGKHAHNYVIFNLSSPGRTTEPNTRESGWPENLAPSLERLCALCKELDSWLNGAPNRVAVLHAKGGKERLGVAVSAYMNYSSICGSRDQALDRFAMRRFLDDKIGPLHVPSHRRYVEYFSGLLSGSLRISPSPLYLTHLTVLGVPQFEPTGCRAFLKVYEGLTPVYTSDLYSVTNAREFTVNLGGLRLRGDILIKCYHRVYSKQSREVMFSLQFHTCVITENVVSFPRSEIDIACDDPRCPADSVVTLYFASDAKRQDGIAGPVPAPTPAVPHASAHHDPILHWDSYTNLEISDDEGRETPLSPQPPSNSSIQTSPRGLGYTCGPIDGSLYAVVNPCGNQGPRGSPLTVSMDSGISSAPPQRPSPPENEAIITESESSHHHRRRLQTHGDLDKLLHDMMLTVESMPDPPCSGNSGDNYLTSSKIYTNKSKETSNTMKSGADGNSSPYRNYNDFGSLKKNGGNYSSYKKNDPSSSSITVRKDTTERREEIRSFDINYGKSTINDNNDYIRNNGSNSSSSSYRKNNNNSQSFSPPGNIEFIDEDIPYHARQTSQPFTYGATTDMIKQQILSSPSLVRKASVRGNNAPVVQIEDIVGTTNTNSQNGKTIVHHNFVHTPDPPPEFANGSNVTNTKIVTDYTDGLSWLRQQQLKLAARRDERSPSKQWRQESGNRVIGELRNVQLRGRRQDGYASDSAVLDGDDDLWTINSQIQPQIRSATYTSAPASPLLPQRSSSRKYNHGTMNGGRQRSESFNERPFVSVKRGYEMRSKRNETQSPQMSPRTASISSTAGTNAALVPLASYSYNDNFLTNYNESSGRIRRSRLRRKKKEEEDTERDNNDDDDDGDGDDDEGDIDREYGRDDEDEVEIELRGESYNNTRDNNDRGRLLFRNNNTPPEPESRSDSYARTESLLNKHFQKRNFVSIDEKTCSLTSDRKLSSYQKVDNHLQKKSSTVDYSADKLSSLNYEQSSSPPPPPPPPHFYLSSISAPSTANSGGLLKTVVKSTIIEDKDKQQLDGRIAGGTRSTQQDPLVNLFDTLTEISSSSLSSNVKNNDTNNPNKIYNNEHNNHQHHYYYHHHHNNNNHHQQQQQQQSSTAPPNASSPSNCIRTNSVNSNNTTNSISSPNQSPKAAWQNTLLQSHNDFGSSWTERSVSPAGAVGGNLQRSGSGSLGAGAGGSTISRPQTPAFPVHPRTPYVNNSSPTVTFACSDNKIYSTSNNVIVNNNNNNSNNNNHHNHLPNNNNNQNNNNNNLNNNINNNNNINDDDDHRDHLNQHNHHHHHHHPHHVNNVLGEQEQQRNYNENYSNYSTTTTTSTTTNVEDLHHRRDNVSSRETGLPPKSPTTQRRLSFPASGSLKQTHNKRWPITNQSASFDYSKDRPVSPGGVEYASQSQVTINQSPAGTPTQIDFAQSPKSAISYSSINSGGQSSPKVYYGSRRSSVHSNTEPQEVADANVKFVRDTSRIWYKPNISREQAISMLKDATPGMFVVRDSNSFPGAFGLALKVATPPPGAPSSPRDPASELVRHFLIEPTSRGVRLKGCANEPVFSSLSALVYQHSLMAMALPCQLLLPEPEAAARALDSPGTSSAQQLLAQGAACNVLYLFTIDTESLTGPQAIKKTISTLFEQRPLPTATIVHFKVSAQGITLTDNSRKLFFRRHYPTNNISFCGIDTDERTWNFTNEENSQSAHNCFGFVARKPAHKSDNQCHIFAELEPGQPATAIVNFVNKVMMGNAQVKANIV